MGALAFNAEEILKMAVQIEVNGEKYYTKAAELQSDDNTKEFLMSLAAMERGHKNDFESMLSEVHEHLHIPDSFDPNDEGVHYLSLMVSGEIFTDPDVPEKALTGDIKTILKTAITLEKDSIMFYLSLLDYVKTDSGRDTIENIIRQEQKHIVTLNEAVLKYS